jgi:hypothetical protein
MKPMTEETHARLHSAVGYKGEPDFLWGNPETIDGGVGLFRENVALVDLFGDGERLSLTFLFETEIVLDEYINTCGFFLLLPPLHGEFLRDMLTQHLHLHPNDHAAATSRGENAAIDVEVKDRRGPLRIVRDPIQFAVGGNASWTHLYFRTVVEPYKAVKMRTPTKWLYLLRDRLVQILPAAPREIHRITRGMGPGPKKLGSALLPRPGR